MTIFVGPAVGASATQRDSAGLSMVVPNVAAISALALSVKPQPYLAGAAGGTGPGIGAGSVAQPPTSRAAARGRIKRFKTDTPDGAVVMPPIVPPRHRVDPLTLDDHHIVGACPFAGAER